jgi:hypothetical protein
MNLDMQPYWLNEETVKVVEEKYGAKYMGVWCTKNKRGGWNETPVDVFYQPTPDTAKGHTHYFGIFYNESAPMICDASSAFSEPIYGVLTDEDEVLVSRCRNDYRSKNEYIIVGGRDYIRRCTEGDLVRVEVNEDKFNFILENA